MAVLGGISCAESSTSTRAGMGGLGSIQDAVRVEGELDFLWSHACVDYHGATVSSEGSGGVYCISGVATAAVEACLIARSRGVDGAIVVHDLRRH